MSQVQPTAAQSSVPAMMALRVSSDGDTGLRRQLLLALDYIRNLGADHQEQFTQHAANNGVPESEVAAMFPLQMQPSSALAVQPAAPIATTIDTTIAHPIAGSVVYDLDSVDPTVLRVVCDRFRRFNECLIEKT